MYQMSGLSMGQMAYVMAAATLMLTRKVPKVPPANREADTELPDVYHCGRSVTIDPASGSRDGPSGISHTPRVRDALP